jgi:hypothetical protein
MTTKHTNGVMASSIQPALLTDDDIVRAELEQQSIKNKQQSFDTNNGVMASDVPLIDLTWKWEGYLPAAYTLVTGAPDSKKTWLSCELASTMSTGRDWPDGSSCIQQGVIIVNLEDNMSLLAGRLKACGADLSRIMFLRDVRVNDPSNIKAASLLPFSLPRDLKLLQEKIIQINAGLVIIDPVSAVFNNVNNNQRVRDDILTPIAAICEDLDVAIVCINHIAKGRVADTNVSSRIGGARALNEVARVSYLVAPDENSKDVATMKQVKNNVAATQKPLRYTVVNTAEKGAHVQWLDDDNLCTSLVSLAGNNETLTQRAICALIYDSERAMNVTEIIQRLTPNIKASTVKMAISRLCDLGMLVKESRGLYNLPAKYRKFPVTITQIDPGAAPQALPAPRTSVLDTLLAP